jgi:hypothetical protein
MRNGLSGRIKEKGPKCKNEEVDLTVGPNCTTLLRDLGGELKYFEIVGFFFFQANNLAP